MRRKEKEITDDQTLETIIAKANVCRLGLTDQETPYIVPLCFGYAEKTLYVHGALKGKKMDLIRQNPRVCFEMESGVEILQSDKPCNWSVRFQSIIGFGLAEIIVDPVEKQAALDIIVAHYTGKTTDSPAYPENSVTGTAVIRIRITRMTGKQSGF